MKSRFPCPLLFRRIIALSALCVCFLPLFSAHTPLQAQDDITTLNWEFSSQGLPTTGTPPRVLNITALVSAPNRFAPTTILYAATAGAGVFRSSDTGRTWAAVNIGLTNLTVNALFADGSTIYAGTASGLFRTGDAGQRWEAVPVRALFNGFPFGTSFITCGVIGQVGGRKTIFVGSINGVFRTFDDGITWEYFNQGLPSTQYISALHVFNQRLFAGTPNDGVLFIGLGTANDSWRQPRQGLFPLSVSSFASLGTRLIAGTNGAGVFQSMDEGTTWTPINSDLANPNVSALAVAGTRLYAATTIGIYATANAGRFWTNINTGFPIRSAGSILPFENQLFVAAGSNVLRGTVFFTRPPIINLVSPSSTPSRLTGEPVEITLTGREFNNPLILFDGVAQQLVRWSPTVAVFRVPASQLVFDGVKIISLQNADGQRTTSFFTVSGAVAPFIADIEPDSVTVGDPPFDIQIVGRTFFNNPRTNNPDSSAKVVLGRAPIAMFGVPVEITGRVGTASILGRVPSEAIAEPGRKILRVTNPNGQFFDFPFRVRAFPPRIVNLDPPRVSVGNSDFELTINGQNFFTERNVEEPGLPPIFIRLANVPLRIIENTTSSRVVVAVPATLVTSEATLTLRLTNADGQFAETRLNVVPFSLSPISTPQTRICPGVTTPLNAMISSGVPPFRVVWSPAVDSSSVDNNGNIRAFISPTQPTRYTLTVTDRNGAGVPLTTSIQMEILQPQASAPAAVAFDTVNTFFRLATTQTVRFSNTSPDGTTLVIGTPRSSTGAFRIVSGVGASVPAGQSLDLPVVFEPTRDGAFLDTLTLTFGPCDRFVRVVVSGFRTTPVLPPPVLLPVATQPDGRVPNGTAPPLSWLPSEFLSVPTNYTVQIARVDAAFSQQTGLTSPQFTSTVNRVTTTQPAFTLQPNTAYSWTIRASNSVTGSTWSIPLYFITPPAAAQRMVLDPTRLEFGNVVLNETERRGIQTRLNTQQTTPLEVVGAEIFPPASAPRSAFSLNPTFNRSTVTTRSPASFITTFSPRDTVLHQGVVRFRAASGDTLYALLSGTGVTCLPASVQAACAETEIGFRFAPFKNNIPRPEVGDTVTVQVLMRRSSGLDNALYAGRAQNFTADIWIVNANVLFPLSISQPANLTDQQRTITPNRIRLRNVAVARGNRTSDVVLAEFRARALLTDTTTTAIRLAEFTWNDAGQGAATGGANIRRILRDTAITLETYGRLIRPRGTAVIAALGIAPNPAGSSVEALVKVNEAADIELSIVSSMGLTMRTEKATLQEAGDYAITLNTANLSPGAYTLVARRGTEIVSKQLIVLGQ
ncbi:MAG: hypothetical protein MUF71_19610 [Candidatus Kapabacteria bacterium]|jgi:hypothetical protein|nr:hypothetical protein [Candidatus Kapabacteria bacterium]